MANYQRDMVLDCETCNLTPTEKPEPGNNLTYDIGTTIIEPATGNIIEQKSFVVEEIFFGEAQRMQSAYYANKLPQYFEEIANGTREVKSFFEVLNYIATACKQHNIKAIIAHNARFDVDALNTTLRYLTGLDYIRALPDSVEIWDSMKMWNAVKPKAYTKFCDANGYKTKHKTPRDRLTAEIIYRYLSGNNDFVERHTAKEDTDIESAIVFACYKTHKRMKEARVLYQAKA